MIVTMLQAITFR